MGGFRSRLLLSLVLAVVITASLVGGLAYWRFGNILSHEQQHILENTSLIMLHALVVTPEKARLDPTQVDNLAQIGHTRFRVVRDQQVAFEVGGRFPEQTAGWAFYTRPLEHGFVLEAALSTDERSEALANLLRTEVLALPIALALALGSSYFLFAYLMRPIRRLTEATNELTQQRFPKALPIPSGNDEIANLTRNFNRMSTAIQGFLERERSFTRYSSHELRTPLATLRMQIEALEQGLLSHEEAVPVVKTHLARLERILAGLLELSRSPQTEPQPIELGDVLQTVLAGFSMPERDRVEVLGSPQTKVLGYDLLLQQALGNLIQNALKFSKSKVQVRVEASSQVDIVVLDQGCGVPDDKLAQLGDPFVRLQPQVQGVGLGLALVRHIAGVLGGEVVFHNRPEGGLEARLSLPKAKAITEVRRVA